MSDLTATHCGCNTPNPTSNGCSSWIWILILLSCCNGGDSCGCGGGLFGNNLFGGENNCCSWIWILILLSACCN